MKAFKQATKRIVAVAASATLVSSMAFGNLGNYPSAMVSDGEFNGNVVVGADASASDSTAAMSIIDDLRSQFSGDNEQVRITYRSSGSDGGSVDVIKSNSQLNYGESLGNSTVTDTLDDGDVDFLADRTFDNGASDEDYTQEIQLMNGMFNYALKDEVDGVEDITDGIFYNSGETYMVYTMEFDNVVDISTDDDQNEEDFVGENLNIMGNEFTITSVKESSGNLTELELIGGANKVSLGEGESSTVTVDGEEYEIDVQSVSDTKVLLSVNGESDSIDEFDTEELSGVNIAVTDLVASSRDSVKGYAEVVVGGQKVTLGDNDDEVKVNDEDVSDLGNEDYLVESDISDDGGFGTVTITYKVDDDMLLQAGDSLPDPLFQGFELRYDGTNDPDYETLELTNGDDTISLSGTHIGGNDFDREFLYTNTTNGTNGATYLRGDQDEDRIFFSGSNLSIGSSVSGITVTNNTANNVTFDLDETGIEGSGFFLYDDEEEQYLYEVSNTDATDDEVDFDEIIEGTEDTELSPAEVFTDLEISFNGAGSNNSAFSLDIANLGSEIGFANELMLDFSSAEDASGIEGTSTLTFSLDSADTDEDQTGDDGESLNVTFSWDGTDDELDIDFSGSQNDIVNKGGDADVSEENDDTRQYVTAYGTMYEHDNDEGTFLNIMVPEEQVYGMVSLVTGGSSGSEMTTTVSADQVEDKREELEDEGYTIVDTETLSSEEVEFDIEEPMIDSDVSGMEDMIVVGGPAVNEVAADLLGLSYPTYGEASGVDMGEGVIRYFEDSNSVLVYGYSAADTTAAVERLNEGGLSGNSVNVQ